MRWERSFFVFTEKGPGTRRSAVTKGRRKHIFFPGSLFFLIKKK